MYLSDAENQSYYDKLQTREKQCAAWLKVQSKTVRKEIQYSALFGVLNGVSIIAQAAIFALLLQAIIIDKAPWENLFIPALLLLLIMPARGVCIYYQQIWGFEAGAKIRNLVRQQLLEKIARLGHRYLKQTSSGELSRLTLEHADALEFYFSRYLPQHYLVGILPLLTILIVLPVNWVVGIIFLVTGPLTPVFMALIGMGAAAAQRRQFLAMSRMSGYFLDRLQGLPTLKLFGQAVHELKAIDKMAAEFREKTMEVLRIAFLSSAVLEFFSAVSVALVAVYVGLGLLDQIHFGPAAQITLSEALFVLLVAPEFFMPLRQLAVFYHDKAAALGAADALLALLEQSEIDQVPFTEKRKPIVSDLDAPVIEFQGVRKVYGAREVLTNINFTIGQGEKIALIGESGAGKTTLINLLLGLEQATEGRIMLNGQPVSQDSAFQCIAWVSQSAYIFHGGIGKNIALSNPGAAPENIMRAADAAGVMTFCEQLPQGLETLVGERGYGLSGGQAQRIALARAFLKDSPIILLDEPTANLASADKTQLMETVERLFADKTVLIASHDPIVIQHMQRCLRIHQGQLVE